MPAETGIPLQDKQVKKQLLKEKGDNETWDEFMKRKAITNTTNDDKMSGTINLGTKKATFTTTV